MKKTLLFFVLFYCLTCFSQEESAGALYNEGVQEITNGNFNHAVSLLEESAVLSQENGDKRQMSKAYNSLGLAYTKLSDYQKALKNYSLSLAASNDLNDVIGIARTSKELGNLYAIQKNYNLALQHLTSGAKHAKQLNDEILEADCLSGAGVVYEKQQKLDEALHAYSQALAIYRARGKEREAGEVLSNMGRAYDKQNNFQQSVLNYKEALGNFNNLNDRRKVADILNDLGAVHARIEDYNESLRLYEQAYLDALSIKYNEVVIKSALGMANAYENLGQYPESIRYHKLFEQKQDSFLSAKHLKDMAQLKLKYEKQGAGSGVVTEDGEIATSGFDSELTSDQKRFYTIIIIGLSSVLLLTLGLIWRRKHQLKSKLTEERMMNEAERQEHLKLVQDIHSDLDSKLSKINFLSEAIVEKTHGMPTIKSSGEAMQEETKKIEENIRDLVWLLTPRSTALSSFINNTRDYVSDYFKGHIVEVLFSIPDELSAKNTISKESQKELTTVIKQCIANVAEDPQATKVFFGMTYTGTRLMVSIKDNGNGFDKADARENSRKRMETHLNLIGGIMKIDSEPGWGTMVKIIIPINRHSKKSLLKRK